MDEKPLAIWLLENIERIYLQNICLTTIISAYAERYPIHWQRDLRTMLDDPANQQNAHQRFAELWEEARQQGDLERLVRALQRVFPTNKDVN